MGELYAYARDVRWPLTLLLGFACNPSAVPPSSDPTGPPKPVAVEQSELEAIASSCGTPCTDPLPTFATQVVSQRGGFTFVELAQPKCRVPDFELTPRECMATCDASGLSTVAIDFGPLNPRYQKDLCELLEAMRGPPSRGDCLQIADGVLWDATAESPRMQLLGHLELKCVQPSPPDPNQSDGSNSMSP